MAGSTTAFLVNGNGGGDPVTALGVRNQATSSSILERHTEVLRSLADNTIKFQNSNKAGP
ncbi:hypothetical protein F4678DRAFT_464837 [Xylaria arbuscula]|nr:hypothetical protein F4678DRAFT_464837 [Xylaria arbuscula]